MPRARLITLPPSHFSEKARWALDRAGIEYLEDRQAPGFHRLALALARAGRTVPVLITGNGIVRESGGIMRWADQHLPEDRKLYPEAHRHELDQIEPELDKNVGFSVPRFLYYYVIPIKPVFNDTMVAGAPTWQATIFRIISPLVRFGMTRALKISQAAAERSRSKLSRALDDLSQRLADGRPFLLGDRLTGADLTLASLTGPLFGGDRFGGAPGPIHSLPEEARSQIEQWAQTPAGQHVQRLYREHRQVSPN